MIRRKYRPGVSVLSLGVALALGLGCGAPDPQGGEAAESVYRNGRIYTLIEGEPWAEAVAITNGRFVAVGTTADIEQLIGPDTDVVDLGGRFVMPGIQDAHIHTQMAAEFALNLSVDPDGSWSQIADAIRAYASRHPEKESILGGSLPWLTEVIGDESGPPAHRSILDELAPDHAVALWDVGGHAMLANSLALQLVGIDRDTPDPEGGTIERDLTGAATGVLRELATNLILENAAALTVEQYADGLEDAIDRLSSVGVTSINEVWAFPKVLAALKRLDEEGRLRARVVASIAHPVEFTTDAAKKAAEEAIASRSRYEGERLRARYIKFVLDGSAGGQTLAMIDPYLGTDFRGEMRNPPEVMKEEVARLHAEGLGSVIHAVGDRAVRTALDAVEGALARHGENGTRHVIAHTVFVNPDDLPRFSELGVIAEFSPYFWQPSEGAEILRDEIGKRRLAWGFPVREILTSGTHVAAGSDWPVVFDPNPFPAIETLVTREVPGGSDDHFGKEHAVTLEEALRIFTLGGAYALYQEEDTGSIEKGKKADFIILDRNLLEIPIREVHQTQVLTTVLDGEAVFRAAIRQQEQGQ